MASDRRKVVLPGPWQYSGGGRAIGALKGRLGSIGGAGQRRASLGYSPLLLPLHEPEADDDPDGNRDGNPDVSQVIRCKGQQLHIVLHQAARWSIILASKSSFRFLVVCLVATTDSLLCVTSAWNGPDVSNPNRGEEKTCGEGQPRKGVGRSGLRRMRLL